MGRASVYANEVAEGQKASALKYSGVAGNYVSCPHSDGLGLTGDLDIRIRCLRREGSYSLVSKQANSSTRSFSLQSYTLERLRLHLSPDGVSLVSFTTNVGDFPADETTKLHDLRVTVKLDNGSGNSIASFYESFDFGHTWVLKRQASSTSLASIYENTVAIEIGSQYLGTWVTTGIFQKAEIRNGIDGTIVASWDGRIPATRQRDPQGNIWTVNGTANAWQKVGN